MCLMLSFLLCTTVDAAALGQPHVTLQLKTKRYDTVTYKGLYGETVSLANLEIPDRLSFCDSRTCFGEST